MRPREQSGWRLAAALHSGRAGSLSGYPAVIAPGRRSAWAFGGTNPGGPSVPTAARRTDGRWRPAALPAGLRGFIISASASGPDNVWAVSYLGSYVLHWNGRHWAVARRWRGGGTAATVVALSRSDVWVFGTGPQSAAWRFNGRTWRQEGGWARRVSRASGLGRHVIWALARTARGERVVRYRDGRWAPVAAGPELAKVQLSDILAVPGRGVWVTGTTRSGSRLVAARWDGRRWTRFTAPWGARSERFAADGRGGIWIPTVSGALTSTRWIMHVTGSGHWSRIAVSAGTDASISDLALIPGTRSLWGSGGLLHKTAGDAAIWAYGRVPRRGRHR